jgi:hypothetical protein
LFAKIKKLAGFKNGLWALLFCLALSLVLQSGAKKLRILALIVPSNIPHSINQHLIAYSLAFMYLEHTQRCHTKF